jgi:hypothetical protein
VFVKAHSAKGIEKTVKVSGIESFSNIHGDEMDLVLERAGIMNNIREGEDVRLK